jgi:Luciferase-like monooxygenase
MKFTWFNLMPWPDLPDDFRQSHRSVWVDISSSLFDPVRANAVYHEYMDQLEYADELGFDGIGVNEHHQNGYGIMPSPNIIAAGLARRTSDAAICVIGNSIALYNPPIRVAEEFAMLDCISGGRLVAGFPVGTPMDTNFCYGQIPALTRDKYAENHDLIMRAWAEDEPFAFDGKYNQLRYVNCWPKPIQQPHPPVYIPGGGSIETWDFCLDHDYNYSYLSFGGYLNGKRLLGPGRRPGQGRIAVPRRLRPDHLRRRQRRRGRAAVQRTRPVLLQPVPARLSGLLRPAGLSHHRDDQVGFAGPVPLGHAEGVRQPDVAAARRRRPHHRRQSGHGDRPHEGSHHDAARRPRLLPLPQR